MDEANHSADFDKGKLYRVHTSDSKKMIISIASFNMDNLNALYKMLHIGKNTECIDSIYMDAWIGMTSRIFNIILSIMRDGITSYYNFLAHNGFPQKYDTYDKPETYSDCVIFDKCSSGGIENPNDEIYGNSGCLLGCGCKSEYKHRIHQFICNCSKECDEYGIYIPHCNCKEKRRVTYSKSQLLNIYDGYNCADCLYLRKKTVDELTQKKSLFALNNYIDNCTSDRANDLQINFNKDIICIIKNIADKLDEDKEITRKYIDDTYKAIMNSKNNEENQRIVRYLKIYFNFDF